MIKLKPRIQLFYRNDHDRFMMKDRELIWLGRNAQDGSWPGVPAEMNARNNRIVAGEENGLAFGWHKEGGYHVIVWFYNGTYRVATMRQFKMWCSPTLEHFLAYLRDWSPLHGAYQTTKVRQKRFARRWFRLLCDIVDYSTGWLLEEYR